MASLDDYASTSDGAKMHCNKTASLTPRREFVRGPLPVDWLARAAALPGQALAVGLAIWFRRGIERRLTFPLYPSALGRFHVNRWSSYRALTALEKAGLATVQRQRGRSPVVTILGLSENGSTSMDAAAG